MMNNFLNTIQNKYNKNDTNFFNATVKNRKIRNFRKDFCAVTVEK